MYFFICIRLSSISFPLFPLFEIGDWPKKELQLNKRAAFPMFIQAILVTDEKLRGLFLNNGCQSITRIFSNQTHFLYLRPKKEMDQKVMISNIHPTDHNQLKLS